MSATQGKVARILLVHDDDYFAGRAVAALEAAGLTVVRSSTVVDALDRLNEASPLALLITRMRFGLNGSNGIVLAKMARQRHRNIKIIFIALRDFEEDAAGFGKFLPAPVAIPDLVAAVNEALADR